MTSRGNPASSSSTSRDGNEYGQGLSVRGASNKQQQQQQRGPEWRTSDAIIEEENDETSDDKDMEEEFTIGENLSSSTSHAIGGNNLPNSMSSGRKQEKQSSPSGASRKRQLDSSEAPIRGQQSSTSSSIDHFAGKRPPAVSTERPLTHHHATSISSSPIKSNARSDIGSPLSSMMLTSKTSQYVTNVIVVPFGEKAPPNYFPIKYLAGADNASTAMPYTMFSRNAQVFVERSASRPPITGLSVFFPNKGESTPPLFTECRSTIKGGGPRVDLNSGAPHSCRAYLAICRGDGAPIFDIGLCRAAHVPVNWTGIERSPLGFKASVGNTAGRIPRSQSGNSVGATGLLTSTIMCVRYDLKEISKFRENDMMIRQEQSSEGGSEGSHLHQHSVTRRKSSLIGQMFGSVTPTTNPLRKQVLARRSTATTESPLGKNKTFFPQQSGSPPQFSAKLTGESPAFDDETSSEREASSANDIDGRLKRSNTSLANSSSVTFFTRMQRARERALIRSGLEEGLGVSPLAFDPEVAGLLISSDLLDRIISDLSSVVRGSSLDALLALREMLGLIRSLEILPSVPFSEQMTMYDFLVCFGASMAIERGIDLLVAPACRIVVEGNKEAKNGLHPATLHHSLSVICRANDFFSKVKEDFFTVKAHALAQESTLFSMRESTSKQQNQPPQESPTSTTDSSPISAARPPSSFVGIERAASSDRLESIVARLSGFGLTPVASAHHHAMMTNSATSTPSVLGNVLGYGGDPQFHFVFPAETPEQTLGDRAYVMVQAVHSFFQDLLERGIPAQPEHVPDLDEITVQFERISNLVSSGPFSIETSLEVHLCLTKIFQGTSPFVDLVFSLIWLAAFHGVNPAIGKYPSKTIMLQDFLVLLARLDSPIVGSAVRRLVFPLVISRLNQSLVMLAAGGGADNNSGNTNFPRSSSNGSVDGGESANGQVPWDVLLDDSLNLLSILWRLYRKFLKAEMSVAFHSLLIPGMRQRALPHLKLRLLELLMSWLDADRSSLVELHLNFEHDCPVPHWTVFQDVIDALCSSIRPAIHHQHLHHPTPSNSRFAAQTTSRRGSGGSTGMASNKRRLNFSSSSTGTTNGNVGDLMMAGDDDEFVAVVDARISSEAATILVTCMRHLVNLSGTIKTTSWQLRGWGDDDEKTASRVGEGSEAQQTRRLEEKKARELLGKALNISKTNGSAKSAVSFLVAAGQLEETPQAVSQFLRLNLNELGESNIGDYLGEGGKTSTEQAFMVALRDAYIKAAPRNVNDTLDHALRRFLTQAGFRLPGEGQKVERMLEAFARRFVMDHPEIDATEESILVLAFSLVMLNTDLHKPQIKQKSKMKKEDFFRNVSGINSGRDFPRDFLNDLYDSILSNEIRFPKSGSMVGLSGSATPPAEINGGGGGGESLDDSNSLGSEGGTSGSNHKTATTDGAEYEQDLYEETLRGLALECERGLSILATLHDREFAFHTALTKDAAKIIFESLSAKVFQVCSSVLEDDAARFELIGSALELLEYALTTTLFLNISGSERRCFASLLAKLVMLHSAPIPDGGKSSEQRVLEGLHLEQEWFIQLMSFETLDNDIGAVVANIHTLALQVAERITAKQHQQELRNLALRLGYPELVSNNAERTFIREGPLKIKNREKIFFLFSDCLLRCDVLSYSKLRIEENLPLRTLRVFSTVPDAAALDGSFHPGSPSPSSIQAESRFEVRSPLSSFVVQATSSREKDSWVRDINLALMACAETHSRMDQVRSPIRSAQGNRSLVVGSNANVTTSSSQHHQQKRNAAPSKMSAVGGSPVASSPKLSSSYSRSNAESSEHTSRHKTAEEEGLRMEFQGALALAKKQLVDPQIDTATKLLVYGYFKQASKGDCSESMPVDSDNVKKAKWHAWRAHHGTPKEDAQDAFVRVVTQVSRKARGDKSEG